MNPSASAIRDAVEKLKKSPGVFQRLAERYAQATFPQRFRELVPKGRNPEDVAVKGWPDAYAVLPDGRLDAIEATHSPDWERHLDEDCEKAGRLGPGRLAGFLLRVGDCGTIWYHASITVLPEFAVEDSYQKPAAGHGSHVLVAGACRHESSTAYQLLLDVLDQRRRGSFRKTSPQKTAVPFSASQRR